MRSAVVISLLLGSSAFGASAVTFLTPGFGVDLLPIGNSRVAGDQIQQVYSSTQFGTAPLILYSLAFSSSATTGGDATSLSGDADLTLSTTNIISPDAPGTWSLSNEGTDQETVFNGSFTSSVLHNSTFDIVFTFSTPFTYDPTAGDLLLNFRWVTNPSANGYIALAASYTSALVGSNSLTSQFGNFGSSGVGVATQFSTSPEPGTLVLLGAALLLGSAGVARRRKRGAQMADKGKPAHVQRQARSNNS